MFLQTVILFFIVFFALALFSILAAKRGLNPLSNQYREISKYDNDLIEQASNSAGLDEPKVFYIRQAGRYLHSYNLGYANNMILFQVSTALITAVSYISVGLTGSDFFPCEKARSYSFLVNLVGAFLSTLTQFFLLDKKAHTFYALAAKLRLELLQFIGGAKEYAAGDRYASLTDGVDEILIDDLKAGQEIGFNPEKAKKAQDKVQDTVDRLEDR